MFEGVELNLVLVALPMRSGEAYGRGAAKFHELAGLPGNRLSKNRICLSQQFLVHWTLEILDWLNQN